MNNTDESKQYLKNVEVHRNNSDQFSDRISELVKPYKSNLKFAKACGVSESVVRKWRNGGSNPSREHLIAVSTANNVNLLWLITGEGEMRGDDTKENAISRPVGEEEQIANQLDKVEQQLDLQPQPIPQWQQDKVWASIHQQLKNIAALKTISPSLIAKANNILRFSYADKEAEEKSEQRVKAVRNNFREVMYSYKDATKEIGYEPPILITQAIKTAMFTEGLTKEGAIIILNALKEQKNLK